MLQGNGQKGTIGQPRRSVKNLTLLHTEHFVSGLFYHSQNRVSSVVSLQHDEDRPDCLF
jgi:hypothetical protein